MDKEVIIAVVLAALVLVSLFQTFQLVNISNKIATGALSAGNAGTSTSTSGQNLGSGSSSGGSTGSSSSGGSDMVGGC